MLKTCLHLALLATASMDALAHEFWLEPSSWRMASGQAVTFRLLVGDGFPGEPRPRNPDRLVRFDIVGPDGVASAIEGLSGEDPAGSARLSRPGIHVVAFQGKPVRIELAAERFEGYLAHAGLERISELRAARGATALAGRERYSRCAKTLVAAGEPAGAGFDRVVGLPLELVPEVDPFALKTGDGFRVRALLHGDPLQGLTILAFAREGGNRARIRTDAEGRARFPVDQAGNWMISGVHMWESKDPDADWESLWSSLTFVVTDP
jgi:uncharacterized GH25 family protein